MQFTDHSSIDYDRCAERNDECARGIKNEADITMTGEGIPLHYNSR